MGHGVGPALPAPPPRSPLLLSWATFKMDPLLPGLSWKQAGGLGLGEGKCVPLPGQGG